MISDIGTHHTEVVLTSTMVFLCRHTKSPFKQQVALTPYITRRQQAMWTSPLAEIQLKQTRSWANVTREVNASSYQNAPWLLSI